MYEHNGIEFIKEYYEIEYTLSFDDAVDDLTIICRNNGGWGLMVLFHGSNTDIKVVALDLETFPREAYSKLLTTRNCLGKGRLYDKIF